MEGQSGEACSECRLPSSINPESPPWQSWVSLKGARLSALTSFTASAPVISAASRTSAASLTSLTSPSSPIVAAPNAPLSVYAARIPDGAAILVANNGNNGDEKAPFDLSVKLNRGVYSVDRLVLDMKMPETSARVERLESVVLGGTGKVSKPGSLAAGSLAVYRFTNRCAEVQGRYDSVKSGVRAMRSARPSECRILMIPLNECEGHLGALAKGIQPKKRYDSLRYIHRALLTVAHAQALCQNYRGQGRLPRTGADQLDGALDRLQSALTELSAGCLNLLPSLAVTAPDTMTPNKYAVTVQLTNAGQQSVSMVRLGADGPAGATVSPSDRAMFNILKPGETARATFTIRSQADTPPLEIAADIAWLAARTPAHLHLKNPL